MKKLILSFIIVSSLYAGDSTMLWVSTGVTAGLSGYTVGTIIKNAVELSKECGIQPTTKVNLTCINATTLSTCKTTMCDASAAMKSTALAACEAQCEGLAATECTSTTIAYEICFPAQTAICQGACFGIYFEDTLTVSPTVPAASVGAKWVGGYLETIEPIKAEALIHQEQCRQLCIGTWSLVAAGGSLVGLGFSLAELIKYYQDESDGTEDDETPSDIPTSITDKCDPAVLKGDAYNKCVCEEVGGGKWEDGKCSLEDIEIPDDSSTEAGKDKKLGSSDSPSAEEGGGSSDPEGAGTGEEGLDSGGFSDAMAGAGSGSSSGEEDKKKLKGLKEYGVTDTNTKSDALGSDSYGYEGSSATGLAGPTGTDIADKKVDIWGEITKTLQGNYKKGTISEVVVTAKAEPAPKKEVKPSVGSKPIVYENKKSEVYGK